MSAARHLQFADAADARDYLSMNGFRRFSERTYQSRYGKTARWNRGPNGSVSLTII